MPRVDFRAICVNDPTYLQQAFVLPGKGVKTNSNFGPHVQNE